MNIKKAIIIGAYSGIGKGISLELLKKGYKIAISARRKERLDEIKKLNPDMVIVKEYDSSKGYGFITSDDGEDYFVHVSGLREYLKNKGVRPGQKVSFDVDRDIKGDRAVNVRVD